MDVALNSCLPYISTSTLSSWHFSEDSCVHLQSHLFSSCTILHLRVPPLCISCPPCPNTFMRVTTMNNHERPPILDTAWIGGTSHRISHSSYLENPQGSAYPCGWALSFPSPQGLWSCPLTPLKSCHCIVTPASLLAVLSAACLASDTLLVVTGDLFFLILGLFLLHVLSSWSRILCFPFYHLATPFKSLIPMSLPPPASLDLLVSSWSNVPHMKPSPSCTPPITEYITLEWHCLLVHMQSLLDSQLYDDRKSIFPLHP